ncbi:hypothetical protein ACQCWJ_23070, partial [Bacillus thuringiensis]
MKWPEILAAAARQNKSPLYVKCTPIVRHSLTIGGAFFMAKFSSKEKIQAVKRYLDGTESGK